ncbi:MAG: hypothetical protein HHJ16_11645 [Polaromonas sp.]|uniref:DUF2946 family protein n=1 Tax=Polaromonas sp. TaxID=1869339 RepID=UPI0018366F7A|nr:DUF2946 family protein [Polaromonas sp.]NMM10910.1 hypothetical protein [Polaromonas sp.]
MSYRPDSRSPLPAWARLAAWLSFSAVLFALLAPASMLAQDVRSGKLSGLCSVTLTGGSSSDTGSGDAPPAGSHCDLCGSPSLVPPPLLISSIPCFAGYQVACIDFPADLDAAVPGLPFSRGPPAL